MVRNNPQLAAICLLLKKFGKRVEGGAYEVEVTYEEMASMSPHGTFQEVPRMDVRTVKWQYFPNITIDATPISVTPNSEPENPDGKELLRDSTGDRQEG